MGTRTGSSAVSSGRLPQDLRFGLRDSVEFLRECVRALRGKCQPLLRDAPLVHGARPVQSLSRRDRGLSRVGKTIVRGSLFSACSGRALVWGVPSDMCP